MPRFAASLKAGRFQPAAQAVLPPPFYIHGSNLVCLYRPDRDRCTLSGSNTTALTDYSPNANHLNVALNSGPVFNQTGRSSRPYFAANNQGLRRTSFSGYPSGSGYYIWAVAKPNAINAYIMLLDLVVSGPGAYDSGQALRFEQANHLQAWAHMNGAVRAKSGTTAISAGTYYTLEAWVPTSGTLSVSLNMEAAQNLTGIGSATTDVAIGYVQLLQEVAANGGNVDLYESGCAKAWSQSAQDLMRAYFRRYYGF